MGWCAIYVFATGAMPVVVFSQRRSHVLFVLKQGDLIMLLGYLLRNNPQEVYSVTVLDKSFVFTVTKAFCEYVLWQSKQCGKSFVFEGLVSFPSEEVAAITFSFPFISFPNYAHRRIDWEEIWWKCEQMQFLFQCLNVPFLQDGVVPSEFCLSEKQQLMIVETACFRENVGNHGCGINLGFNQDICQSLNKTYSATTDIPECHEAAFRFYFGLSSVNKKEFAGYKKRYKSLGASYCSLQSYVRAGGIPQFVVPGNCACLGAQPETFKEDREMDSHNLDTPLQQIAMLASVFMFWSKVLKPLSEGVVV